MKYIDRLCADRLHSLLRSFPAVLLVGPRQCGKSTLARHALPEWTHLDLERPSDLAMLTADLEGFFDTHSRVGGDRRGPTPAGDVRRLASCH